MDPHLQEDPHLQQGKKSSHEGEKHGRRNGEVQVSLVSSYARGRWKENTDCIQVLVALGRHIFPWNSQCEDRLGELRRWEDRTGLDEASGMNCSDVTQGA